MLLWSGRLPLSPVCAISAYPICLLELVLTLSGGLVDHLQVLCGLALSRQRCCQDGIAPVGYAVTGQESQERADCLAVVMYLVMWLICSQLSAQPSSHILLPPYPT
jgi:hypothetical protein